MNCIPSTIENTDKNAGCEFLGFKYTTALTIENTEENARCVSF